MKMIIATALATALGLTGCNLGQQPAAPYTTDLSKTFLRVNDDGSYSVMTSTAQPPVWTYPAAPDVTREIDDQAGTDMEVTTLNFTASPAQ